MLRRRRCQDVLERTPKGSNVQKAQEELNKLMFVVATLKSLSWEVLFRRRGEREREAVSILKKEFTI